MHLWEMSEKRKGFFYFNLCPAPSLKKVGFSFYDTGKFYNDHMLVVSNMLKAGSY